jgi:hypothetical protein
MAIYQWFARTHNWTPQQVDELTLEQLFWLPVMEEALAEALADYRDKNS